MDESETVEYSEFYRYASPKLVMFLAYCGANLADAADLTQDTLIAAHEFWGLLRRPYPWCRKVAYRRHMDSARKAMTIPLEDLEKCSALIVPDADMAELEAKLELQHQLSRLNSERHRILIAWTYDGATPTEIAQELGMNAGTVRSMLRHARDRLRRLDDEGGASA